MNEQKRKPVGILLTVILIAALLTVCLELGLGYLRPNIPGSIPKHLIHFGIMFALLGSAVLLCLFCPPFKKLWAWIDEHILTQETRPIAIDIIYAIFAGLMLLHHFYVILYYPGLPTGATKFAPIWILFAIITVTLNKSWQSISFRLSGLFLIFTFERLFIKNSTIINNNIVYFISAIYAMFGCLGAFSTIRPSIRKSSMKIFFALWAIATFLLSLIGLYTAWTGNKVFNLYRAYTFIHNGRLGIFSASTITSSNLVCGIIIAIIGFFVSKNKLEKIFFSLISFIVMIANSLTDSRSSFVILSFMLSGSLCLGLWSVYYKKKNNKTQNHNIIIFAFLLLVFSLCVYITIEGQRSLASVFIDVRDNGAFFHNAQAEGSITTPNPPIFQQRDVWTFENEKIDIFINGRYEIWTKGFKFLCSNPETLLCGLSIDGSVASIVGRADHSHNILLQTLLEGGIPSLLLYLSLIFYGVFHSFRIWSRKGVPFWQRILPLPVFSILLWEMVECLTHFSFGHPPMTLFWFFLGATITVSKSLGKDPKVAEQPAIPAESAVTETGE